MAKKLLLLLLLFPCGLWAQDTRMQGNSTLVITPELMVGYTADSNEFFPEHGLQSQLLLNLGWEHDLNPQEWARRLKGPRTGISVGYTDFGNTDSLGGAFTIQPFIEFNSFGSRHFTTQVGTGMSLFTKKYDPETNPNNRAVSTDINWSFRLFMHYRFLSSETIDWRLGLGYFHHSNGHTKLPNQGYNSFLMSVSADIKNRSTAPSEVLQQQPPLQPSSYYYYSLRAGYGINVLSLAYNDKKGVYTVTGEVGKVFNNTFKVGVGMYYRFYEHYYDYIATNQSLVQDGREFEAFKDNPGWNASNVGLAFHGEILLNHFGIDLQLGVNFHKPAYKIDWRINQGWDNTPRDIPEFWRLGEFGGKYRLKSILSSRLGLKYYFFGTHTAPKDNFFAGIHINANGGQADFTEISLGYIHAFNFKNKK